MERFDRRHEANRDSDQTGLTRVRVADPGEVANPLLQIARDRVALTIDTSVYSRNAIIRAIYKFTDRCYVLLSSHDVRPNCYIAYLTAKSPSADLEQLVGEFGNELLDQQLREQLEKQFGEIRSLIVAQAFAEGNLLDRERDDGDYTADPRGIGGPPR